ncbi:MAG: tetratricopeptide repeat protein [Pseudomonadota bacterium]|nr:tetratricopeptide repeat protein [Pseudomonadota bacterium]
MKTRPVFLSLSQLGWSSVFLGFALTPILIVGQATFEEIQNLALEGDASAQFTLGAIHDIGQGVPENNTEAAKWYRLSAEQGNAEAQYNLGVMYDTGEGVPENDAEAVRWHHLAAEQGNADAQYNLGVSYYIGEGVPQDYVHAYAWLGIALASGNEDALEEQLRLEQQMTSSQITEAQGLLTEIHQRIQDDR